MGCTLFFILIFLPSLIYFFLFYFLFFCFFIFFCFMLFLFYFFLVFILCSLIFFFFYFIFRVCIFFFIFFIIFLLYLLLYLNCFLWRTLTYPITTIHTKPAPQFEVSFVFFVFVTVSRFKNSFIIINMLL